MGKKVDFLIIKKWMEVIGRLIKYLMLGYCFYIMGDYVMLIS